MIDCNKIHGITNEDVRAEPGIFSLNQDKQKKTEKRECSLPKKRWYPHT
jgi:hypothetical protein